MFKKKKKRGLIKKLGALLGIGQFGLIFIIIIVVVCAFASNDDEKADVYEDIQVQGGGIFSDGVEAYRKDVEEACKKYDAIKTKLMLPEYVNAILSVMQIESGGTPEALATDPMQASLCGYNKKFPKKWELNQGITDPLYSIECGVQYFADACTKAKVKSPLDFDRLAIAIQGYNYGVQEWVEWMDEHKFTYSITTAMNYKSEKGINGTPEHGQKFLDTYKSALEKLNSVDISDKNGDTTTTIDTSNVQSIIALLEAPAWRLVTNNKFASKPAIGTITATETSTWLAPITIKCWKFKNARGTAKKTTTLTVQVNKNLSEFWQAFFNDVYQDPSKIVINELGTYDFRPNTPHTALSAHSFGVAIDINYSTKGNGYGQQPYTKKQWEKLDKGRTKELTIYQGSPLVQIASKYSLDWGGSWNSTKDGMHFSFCGDRLRPHSNTN